MARRAYSNADKGFTEPIAAAAPPVYNVLLHKYYVDQGYDYVFSGRRKLGKVRLGVLGLGEASAWFDTNVVDGAVNAAGWITRFSGRVSGWIDWIIDTFGVNGPAILSRVLSYPCLLYTSPKIDEYEELLTTNRIWVERTKNVGAISAEDCIALGVTGPVLRASGIKWDLRKAQPYANYKNFDFEIPVGTNGDTYDRYLVRMAEMRQSVRIIEQAVDALPEGPIMAKVPKVMKPPAGEVYHSIEAPKGELGYFIVSDGSTQPYRVRVRPPSFVNLQALDLMCRGELVADVIAVIGTLDIVLGEVDR